MARSAKKCDKNMALQKEKLKKAIEQGNMEGARIYGQNVIREKNQSLNFLRLGSRIDAVASRLVIYIASYCIALYCIVYCIAWHGTVVGWRIVCLALPYPTLPVTGDGHSHAADQQRHGADGEGHVQRHEEHAGGADRQHHAVVREAVRGHGRSVRSAAACCCQLHIVSLTPLCVLLCVCVSSVVVSLSGYMESTMESTTGISTPPEEVDTLIQVVSSLAAGGDRTPIVLRCEHRRPLCCV